MPLLQFAAHDPCQRIHTGLVNIGYFKLRRVQLVTGTHAADNRDMSLICFHDEGDFSGHRIDSIDDIIVVLLEKLVRYIRHKKFFYRIDYSLGIDIQNPLLHHLRLLFANRLRCRMNLPVDIGQTDQIFIDENKMTDTGTGQTFGHIRTDTANPKNSYRRLCQLFHGNMTQQ